MINGNSQKLPQKINSDLPHKSPLLPSTSNKKTSKSDPFCILFVFVCLFTFFVSISTCELGLVNRAAFSMPQYCYLQLICVGEYELM